MQAKNGFSLYTQNEHGEKHVFSLVSLWYLAKNCVGDNVCNNTFSQQCSSSLYLAASSTGYKNPYSCLSCVVIFNSCARLLSLSSSIKPRSCIILNKSWAMAAFRWWFIRHLNMCLLFVHWAQALMISYSKEREGSTIFQNKAKKQAKNGFSLSGVSEKQFFAVESFEWLAKKRCVLCMNLVNYRSEVLVMYLVCALCSLCACELSPSVFHTI